MMIFVIDTFNLCNENVTLIIIKDNECIVSVSGRILFKFIHSL